MLVSIVESWIYQFAWIEINFVFKFNLLGEAVPTGQPQKIEGAPVSSTEVRLRWKPPQQQQQNGDLLGYKIFYLVTESPQELEDGRKHEEEIEVVPASTTSHSLVFLDKFTEYRIQILAFNPAGDGPR